MREQEITHASLFFSGFREHHRRFFYHFKSALTILHPHLVKRSPFLLSFFSAVFLTFLFSVWLSRKSRFYCPLVSRKSQTCKYILAFQMGVSKIPAPFFFLFLFLFLPLIFQQPNRS